MGLINIIEQQAEEIIGGYNLARKMINNESIGENKKITYWEDIGMGIYALTHFKKYKEYWSG